jgi:hypothetical protein
MTVSRTTARRTSYRRLITLWLAVCGVAASALLVPTTATAARPRATAVHTPVFKIDAQGRQYVVYQYALPASALPASAVPAAAPATATPDKATRLTPAQVIADYKGQTIGPSSYTDYGSGTITSFTKSGSKWLVKVKVVNAAVATTTTPDGAGTDGTVHPDDWWNPSTWDLSHILGSFYHDWVLPCVKGIMGGFIGSFGGALMSHIWFFVFSRAEDWMSVTPQGLALTVISSCSLGILHR